jgi:hypothetical protein
LVKKGGHISEETKIKMSLAHKGKKLSEEHKKKLKNIIRTKEWYQKVSNSLKGKHPTPETLLKMSKSQKGKKHTKEQIAKQAQSATGKKRSVEARKKMSVSRMQRKEKMGYLNSPETRIKISISEKERFKNNPMSDETKKKMSLSHKGVPKPPRSEEHKRKLSEAGKFPKPWLRGEKSHFWKDGRTDLVKLIKVSTYYKHWREQIFKRDNYTCVICGAKRNLHPHHLIPLSEILTKYNIKTIEDAYNCAFLWDINNGITHCHDCHKKTETYGLNKNKHKK